VARTIAPDCRVEYQGIRPGEKLHEVMIPVDDARHTRFMGDHYVIEPEFTWWGAGELTGGERLPDDFPGYSSDNNDVWLTPDELRRMIAETE
jgi:UDP-N-acetylglucosamine 4,6-dehydratase